MKKMTLFLPFLLVCLHCFGQKNILPAKDAGIRFVELGDVVIKSTEPEKFVNKVRTQNVYIAINATRPGVIDQRVEATYYVTRFPQPEPDSIALHAVELKLKHFDTAMFDIKLIVFQVRAKDTLKRIIPINGAGIDKKDRLRVLLFDENITLQPGDFYIGYGFHPKHIEKVFTYRMYATDKGQGAQLTLLDDGVKITTDSHMPFVFPFKMSYRKY